MASRIEFGVPFDEYLTWDGVSQTQLKWMLQSAAYFQHRLKHPEKATPAKVLGNAIHTCVLEPREFGSRYFLGPECDRRSDAEKALWAAAEDPKWALRFQAGPNCPKNGKENAARWQSARKQAGRSVTLLTREAFEECTRMETLAAGRTPLTREDWRVCEGISTALRRRDRGAHPYLTCEGMNEVSFQWECPVTGIQRKGRCDRWYKTRDGKPVLVDLKSTASAHPRAFPYSITKYGYDIQAADYCQGMSLASKGEVHGLFVIVAYEKRAPFMSSLWRFSAGRLREGRAKADALLRKLQDCRERNWWPDYSGEVDERGHKLVHVVEPLDVT